MNELDLLEQIIYYGAGFVAGVVLLFVLLIVVLWYIGD